MLNFKIPPLERSPTHSRAATSVESKIATMQHKIFAFLSSLRLSQRLLCSVRFVFVSTFNLQRGRAFVVGITNLSKQAVCVKAKAPTDHVYQRRTWDEFKRVLSVAHASKPVERAENLEYPNQLSGLCWGAVYCSSHTAYNWYRLFAQTTNESVSNFVIVCSKTWKMTLLCRV